MSDYSEELTKAKAKRRGVVDQPPVGSINKRARPFIVETRWIKSETSGIWGPARFEWRKWRAYRTESEARAAMENAARKYTFAEYRMAGRIERGD